MGILLREEASEVNSHPSVSDNNNNNNNRDGHVELLEEPCRRCANCVSCCIQTTDHCATGPPYHHCIGPTIFPPHLHPKSRYRSCRQVHRCWSCYRRSCWIGCWYRNSFRKFDHWIRSKSITQTSAVFVRYSWICVV